MICCLTSDRAAHVPRAVVNLEHTSGNNSSIPREQEHIPDTGTAATRVLATSTSFDTERPHSIP